MCRNRKPAAWLRLLRCAAGRLAAFPGVFRNIRTESREPVPRSTTRLRLLAVADLPEDRQALRRFASELGWHINFLQDLQHAGFDVPVPFSAAVIIPATPERAATLIAAPEALLPRFFDDLPIYLIAPSGSAEADLSRARSLFAAVDEKPMLLSAFRSAVLRIAGS